MEIHHRHDAQRVGPGLDEVQQGSQVLGLAPVPVVPFPDLRPVEAPEPVAEEVVADGWGVVEQRPLLARRAVADREIGVPDTEVERPVVDARRALQGVAHGTDEAMHLDIDILLAVDASRRGSGAAGGAASSSANRPARSATVASSREVMT